MKKTQTVESLLEELISHWNYWEQYEDYYLNTLAPELAKDPSSGDEFEQQVLCALNNILNKNEWKDLPLLINETRSGILRKIEREEREKKRIEAERIALEKKAKLKEQQRILEEKRKKKALLKAEKERVEKENALLKLRNILVEDFQNADKIYQEYYSEIITLDEYNLEKNKASKRLLRIEEAKRKEEKRILEEQRKKERLIEAERKRIHKANAISKIKKSLEKDFLNADNVFQNKFSQILTKEEYELEKIHFVQFWAKKNTKNGLDNEQALAVATYNNHLQVIARAGSGKTTTLVNRAIFLQKFCKIPPNQMLLLAFNKKAADEIKERLSTYFGDNIPHVMTFHAMAYALVHPEESLLYDDPTNATQAKSYTLQSIIDDHIQDLKYKNKIRNLMLEHFRCDWEKIISGGYDKGKLDLLRFRRSLPNLSLRGEHVKSYGEKIIADFLFEHDIPYIYEKNFWWNGINYRPDFTIYLSSNSGVIIEYFGMVGDSDYDNTSQDKREYWEQNNNWELLEIYPNSVAVGYDNFYESFKCLLESNKVQCHRLTEDEIWHRIKDRAIDRFTTTTVGFIQRCRKLSFSVQQFQKYIAKQSELTSVEKQFLDIVQIFYKAYLNRLEATGEEDFDGLMQRAIKLVQEGQTIFERKSGKGNIKDLRYIFIDEYQDFSNLFYRLIEAIRIQKEDIEFFCVGDDWQAINGFAGSDLEFYENFQKYFVPFRKLYISTNYRSKESIVRIGNALMNNLGKPAIAHKKESGTLLIGYVDEFQPSNREKERHSGDRITPIVLRIVTRTLCEDKNVVLISRKNNLPYYVNYEAQQSKMRKGLESYLDLIRSYFPKELSKRITISTAHKYKGLQNDTVIVLDAVNRSYPLIHPDWIFTRVLGDDLEKVIFEERRLFYVALTRASESLIILTEKSNTSPFLQDLFFSERIEEIKWDMFPSVKDENSRLMVQIGNQNKYNGSTYAIKDQLKANGFQWDSNNKTWNKSYLETNFSINALQGAIWSSIANDINVLIKDDNGEIVAEYNINNGCWQKNL